jgi:hypothetical protein
MTALSEPDAWGTSRRSRLFPDQGFLVHADLHNHTTLSDGSGYPQTAFRSLRANGLDVAALTDHSRWASAFIGPLRAPGWIGIDDRAWALTAKLADAADAPGEFVALRGFEWSDARQGHMNVWGSAHFTDPLRTVPSFMRRWWRWLETTGLQGTEGFGTPLAGFNHPGTSTRRFNQFAPRPAMTDRVVTLELFNKLDEYLFDGVDRGKVSPLVACLDAGWRVGLIGVTDEHGSEWGKPDGKGRAGLYVGELTRAGVAEALSARRVFASRVKGLRLDAALRSGQARARMGGTLAHRGGPATVELDLDGMDGTFSVQVLRSGRPAPALTAAVEVTLPGPVLSFEVDLDAGGWVVLRVSDPGAAPDPRAPALWRGHGRGLAYSSPFWLT